MKLRRYIFEGEILRLMSFTLLTKPIALGTQMLMASYFGAGVQMDAYAFALFPIRFLSETTTRIFSSVAIPEIIRARGQLDAQATARYQNAVVLLFYGPLTLLLIAFYLWGNLFVDTVGAQLPPETKEWSYRILQFLSLPGLLLACVGMTAALLNLNRRFRIAALLPMLNAVVVLIVIVLGRHSLGIWVLPLGFAVSNLVQLPFVVVQARRIGALTFARPSIPRSGIRRLANLSWMILVTQSIMMLNNFVDKWFATGLPAGSISALNYSATLINFGQQIFTLSLVVVMFTRMSELLAAGDMGKCDHYVRVNLTKLSNMVVPASVAVFAAAPELVRFLFQRGAFDEADAARTAGALGMYMLGLPALVINSVVTKVFQSLQRIGAKVALAFQYIITNVIGNAILVKTLATTGLAISSSVAINLHLFLSLIVLHVFRNGLGARAYTGIILRAYIMAGVAWAVVEFGGLNAFFDQALDGNGLATVVLRGAAKGGLVIAFYGVQALAWVKLRRHPKAA